MNVSRSAVLINSLDRGKLTLNKNLGSAFEYLPSVRLDQYSRSILTWRELGCCLKLHMLPNELNAKTIRGNAA